MLDIKPLPQHVIWVQDTELLKQELGETAETGAPIYSGIPVKLDHRIPKGVWVMTREGERVTALGAQVGSITPDYKGAARAFAWLLTVLARGSWKPRSRHEPEDT